MAMTRDQILSEVRNLEPGEREALVEDLRQIADDGELTAEQLAELRRRVEAMDGGEATMIPGEQVMREAADFYESRRDGLEAEFSVEVVAVFDLRRRPGSWRP